MEHKLFLVELVNDLLRKILGIFSLNIAEGREIVPTHLVMALFVMIFILAFFKFTVKKPTMIPEKMQVVLENLYKFFRSLVEGYMGKEGRKFIPVIGTLGLFIGVSNLIGLFPEFGSPTANLNVTVGCAVFVFLYYHYQGVRKHGLLHYLKSFVGPIWWLSVLFFPIEIISHFSRPLSLSIRLFGNIFGEDMVIIIIASLVPYIAPMPLMALAIITSLLQAYIFIMLTTIYLAGAMATEH